MFLALSQASLRASESLHLLDSLALEQGRLSAKPQPKLINQTLKITLPAIALALPYTSANKSIRAVRNYHLPSFDHPYDDYLQYAPLVPQLLLPLFGVKGRSSYSEMVVSDLFAIAISTAAIGITKKITSVQRPNGRGFRSFPSGHTAFAFTTATLLHLEYGERYPWMSYLSYLAATSVGVGRIIKNRHWLGDVMVGAQVGIASAELGYWLVDCLYGRSRGYQERALLFPGIDIRLSMPWALSVGQGVGVASAGAGVQMFLGRSSGYFVAAEFMLSGFEDQEGELMQHRSLSFSLGKSWKLGNSPFAVDASLLWTLDSEQNNYPSLQLAPKFALSNRLTKKFLLRYSQPFARRTQYPHSRWQIGSALDIRL